MSTRSETLDNQILTKDGTNLYSLIYAASKRAYRLRMGVIPKIKVESSDNVVVTALLEVQKSIT